jgi:hypothetical protein
VRVQHISDAERVPADRGLMQRISAADKQREKPPVTLPSVGGKTYDFHNGLLRVEGVPQPPLRRL